MTLRRILAAGQSGDIRYGMPVTDVGTNGHVACADGSTWTADLVVAANGAQSAARRVLLPGNEPADLGAAAVYGRTQLSAQVRGLLPDSVFSGRLTGLVDSEGLMLVLGAWDPRQDPGEASADDPASPDLSTASPYLMWAVIGPAERLALTAADPDALHRRARSLVSGWDSGAQRAVQLAQVPDTFQVPTRCSPGMPHWLSSQVTFLGDAVHTMTPAGGEGANAAMHDDAAVLAANLGLVEEGRLGFQAAIENYGAQLRMAGNGAITRSQNYVRR